MPNDTSISKKASEAANTPRSRLLPIPPPTILPRNTSHPLGIEQCLALRGDGGEPRAPFLTGRPTRRQLVLETQFPPDNRESGENTTQWCVNPLSRALPPSDFQDVHFQVVLKSEQRALCVI